MTTKKIPVLRKKPADRKLEIIQAADALFAENGYDNTSVDKIIKKIGVAKGTYYYYFKTKQQILEAIVEYHLGQLIGMVNSVADDDTMDAMAKMRTLLSNSHIGLDDTKNITEELNKPSNRELHELTNVQTVLNFSQPFAKIVEQGNREGVFHAQRPLETMQLLLSGGQFLIDGDLFDFSEQEIKERKLALQDMTERAIGAKPGSFDFMNKDDINSKDGRSYDKPQKTH